MTEQSFSLIVQGDHVVFARYWRVVGGSPEEQELEALECFAKKLDREIRHRRSKKAAA